MLIHYLNNCGKTGGSIPPWSPEFSLQWRFSQGYLCSNTVALSWIWEFSASSFLCLYITKQILLTFKRMEIGNNWKIHRSEETFVLIIVKEALWNWIHLSWMRKSALGGSSHICSEQEKHPQNREAISFWLHSIWLCSKGTEHDLASLSWSHLYSLV